MMNKHPETGTQEPPAKKFRIMKNEDDPPIASASPASIAHEPNASTNEIPAASTQDDPAVIEATRSLGNRLSSPSSSNVERRQTRIDKTFHDIQSYQKGGDKEQKVTNAILYMIAKDNMPLQTMDKEGFRYLMNVTNPHYKVPSRRTVSRLLEGKYEVLSGKIKNHISSIENITVTTDMWTNKQDLTSYLGVTIHFLHQDSMQAVTIGVFPVEEKHTASNIRQRLGQILQEWSIPLSKITCIVTDGSKNMIAAITSLVGSNKHLTCYAHVLHLIVTSALSNAEDPEKEKSVLAVVEKVKKIVRFFKYSSSAASKLKQIQGPGALKLKQSVPTRWNSTYYMIERFIHLAAKVSGVLMELPSDSVEMVSSAELEVLREVADSLKPFEEVCREISAEKYLSSSKVIPLTSCIREKISHVAPNTALGKSFKKSVEKEMTTRFMNLEFSSVLGISTLLDPRFKKLHFQNPLAVGKMVSYINNMLVSPPEAEAAAEEDILRESDSIWAHHAKLHAKSMESTLSIEGVYIKNEKLRRYFLKPIPEFSNQFDPVKYWTSKSAKAPYLSQIALKYLTTVGSSVPCERLFSKAGQIASDSRNRLGARKLNMLLFLNSVEKSEWNL